MIFKQRNTSNNSLRHARLIEKSLLWKKNALKKLTIYFNNNAGRNHLGKVILRTRSARAFKRLRVINFSPILYNVHGLVYRIEYDPNRSSFISLIVYANGICTYSLHTLGVNIGDIVISHFDLRLPGLNGLSRRFNNGDCSNLLFAPLGTIIHCLESLPGYGSTYIRAAGTYGLLWKKFYNIKKCLITLPSNISRSFSHFCIFLKGTVSNHFYYRISFGKAGRKRLLGFKPIVRGVAKNPIDHSHGGGEGKKSKKCFPRTAWGKMLHNRRTGLIYIPLIKKVSNKHLKNG